MYKKILTFCILITMLFSIPTYANATTVNDPFISIATISNDNMLQPRYDYMASNATSLTNVNGKASCAASVTGYNGTTTKIEITMTLQKKSLLWWNNVETWTSTHNTYYGTLSKTISVESGTYRVKAVYKVYSGSSSESVTKYSGEKKF